MGTPFFAVNVGITAAVNGWPHFLHVTALEKGEQTLWFT